MQRVSDEHVNEIFRISYLVTRINPLDPISSLHHIFR